MFFTTDLNGGAYNIRDAKNNSVQDYEGHFYNPTYKVTNEEMSIDFKNDVKEYFSDFDLRNKEKPTLQEKHYQFIKESFDFLEE